MGNLFFQMLILELKFRNHRQMCLDAVLQVVQVLLEVEDLHLQIRVLLFQSLIINIQRVNLIFFAFGTVILILIGWRIVRAH